MQDAQDLDDARFDEMDEEMGVGMGSQYDGEHEDDGPHGAPPVLGGVALGSLSGADARTAGYGGYEAPEQHDDHGDLVSRLGDWIGSNYSLLLTQSRSQPPDGQFPETSRRAIGTMQQPHVRRKSVIPIDPSILKELQGHKS